MTEQNQRPERWRCRYTIAHDTDLGVYVHAIETISAQIEYLTKILERKEPDHDG